MRIIYFFNKLINKYLYIKFANKIFCCNFANEIFAESCKENYNYEETDIIVCCIFNDVFVSTVQPTKSESLILC